MYKNLCVNKHKTVKKRKTNKQKLHTILSPSPSQLQGSMMDLLFWSDSGAFRGIVIHVAVLLYPTIVGEVKCLLVPTILPEQHLLRRT